METIHWDNPHLKDKSLFTVENNDYCLISKSIIIVFTCVTCLLFFVVFGHIIKNCLKKKYDYNESECQGDCGCKPSQCELCQNAINDF